MLPLSSSLQLNFQLGNERTQTLLINFIGQNAITKENNITRLL